MKSAILIGLLALAPLTAEANGYRYPQTNHIYYGSYGESYSSYKQRQYNQYRYYHNDNNEWKYALGGLIVGTIIANQQNKNRQPEYSQPLPAPQKRKVQTCYDEVAYDSNGQPYVARQCYDTWQ